MTLTLGLDTALSGLSTAAERTAVVSRNVAGASDPLATRKLANVITAPGGGVRIASITRMTNEALLENMLKAKSTATAQRTIVTALDRLDETINDPEFDTSPAALVQKLANAIQQYAAAPQDTTRAQSALAAAGELADTLNGATQAVQQVRSRADAEMADSVGRINTLLARFEAVNNEVVKGSRAGADVTDYLDQRDGILSSLSEEVGIRTLTRSNDDMAVYTDSGVTLFDVKARTVSFDRTLSYAPGTIGNPVYADGVPITGAGGTMPVGSGRLIGLTAIRDSITITYQNQLDEVARGLIEAFAESDQSATPSLPDAPGLFTYAGAPAMPATGTLLVGLAGTIKVNANVDPAQGGDLGRLRDGGIAGDPAYVYNPTGASAYSDRLEQYLSSLAAPRAFDTAAQLATSTSVGSLASSSAGWLQEVRKSANDQAEYKDTLLQRSSDALSKVTGVNIDEEMTSLLEIERSYQASTRLIATIDNMLGSLLAAVQ